MSWRVVLQRGIAGGSPRRATLFPSKSTADGLLGSLFGPQWLAHRMFGRIDPHWYLRGCDES